MYVFQLRLHEILEGQSKTPTDLSRATGIRYPTIHKLSQPDARLERMDINLLATICKELGVTLEELGRVVDTETGEELAILRREAAGTSESIEAPTEATPGDEDEEGSDLDSMAYSEDEAMYGYMNEEPEIEEPEWVEEEFDYNNPKTFRRVNTWPKSSAA